MAYCMRCNREIADGSNLCDECKSIVQPVEHIGERYTEQYQQQHAQQTASNQQPNYNQMYYQQPAQQTYYQQPYQQTTNNYVQPYPQQGYGQQPKKPDASSPGLFALSFFFNQIGLTLYIVWKNEYPLKAKSCGLGALIGFCVNIALVFILPFLFAMIGVSAITSMTTDDYYIMSNIISSFFH